MQGFHQEVYDDLLAMQEYMYDPPIYEEALLVMRETIRRVRTNIELLVAHLHEMGYLFHKGGFWENFPPEQRTRLERDYPIFQPPPPQTSEHIALLEHLTGPLPLSLKCFFEEVGSVNLIGLFPSANERTYGSVLDPLCVDSVEIALQQVTSLRNLGLWEEEPVLILSADRFHKYGSSGAGSYNIALPCKAVDAPFLDEPHQTTFVNYLRICFQWGGFPGLQVENRLSPDEFALLTKDLLRF